MNIILCGFMGAGKSTMGIRAAKAFSWEFVDTDRYIEEKTSMSVKEIFDKHGETAFRQMETDAVRELSERSGYIIATGGGTMMNEENRSALSKSGLILLIEISKETVLSRLAGDTTRPLLARPDREEIIEKLMKERLPVYRKSADIIVDGNRPYNRVYKDIINILKNHIDK